MKTIKRIIRESIREVLLENRESKNISLARKFLIQKGYNQDQSQKILDDIRTSIPNSRLGQCKFLLGVVKLYLDGELRNSNNIVEINKLLPYIASETHINEYDNSLNGMSLENLKSKFGRIRQIDSETSRNNSYNKQHIKNEKYRIVKIPNFETTSQYGKYTEWWGFLAKVI